MLPVLALAIKLDSRGPVFYRQARVGKQGRVMLDEIPQLWNVLKGEMSFLVALGETMRQRLIDGKGADPARTVVIPNWADCAEIAPGPRRNAFSLAHGLADRFVIMHSGNVGLSQGLKHVIWAAARLRGLPDLGFVFIGDGVKRPALQEQARSRATNSPFRCALARAI